MVKTAEVLFDDFSGGMNTRIAQGQVPRNQYRLLLNVEPVTKKGRGFTLSKTATTFFTLPTPSPGYTGKSLHRYDDGTTKRLLVHRSDNSMVAQDESAAWSPSIIGGSTDPNGARFVNTPMGDTIWTNGTGAMQVWSGSGTATDIGLDSPVSPGNFAVATYATAGVVDVTGKSTPSYQFCFTYVNARGVESGGSSLSNFAYPVNKTITMEARILTDADLPAEADKIRFYIIGGDINQLTQVGEVVATHPSGGVGGLVATFGFNSYDSEVGEIYLNQDRIPMPDGMDVLCIRQNRLWAGKTDTNTLYFSGYNAYEICSQTSEADGFDGGSLELSGGIDNGLVSLGLFATLLVVVRRRTVDVLYGNQSSQFSRTERHRVGGTNRDCLAVGENAYYVASTDRRIYRFVEGEPVSITESIQDTLDAISQSVWDTLKLVWWNKAVYLTFNGNTNDYAYIFYEEFGGWWCDDGIGARFIGRFRHPTENRDEILLIDRAVGRFIQRAFSATTERSIAVTTGEFQLDADGASPIALTSFDYITSEGAITYPASSGDRPVMRLFYDSNYKDHTIQSATGVLFERRVISGLDGRWLYISLFGKIAAGYINYIAAQVNFYRARRK